MFIDIVFPDNNEAEFLKIAKILGTRALCFVYTKPQKSGQEHTGILAKVADLKKISGKSDLTLIESPQDNREMFQRKGIDIVYNLEPNSARDSVNAKNSGLNQVTAKLANKNKIMIGFSFSSLLNTTKRAIFIGKMKQNIRLCRKFRCNAVVASFAKRPYDMRSESNLKSLMIALGAHPKEAKDMTDNLQKRLILNKKIKNKVLIAPGIEVV